MLASSEDNARMDNLHVSTRLGNPSCQAHVIGRDMGAFDPSAHALFVTAGHSRPGRGVKGCWPASG